MGDISQRDLLVEFFENHPNRDLPHPEVVDWVTAEYRKRTGKVFRDPDRGIRKLSQEGLLIKVRKGVYRYDPELVQLRELEDFTSTQKTQILERDGYKCVKCGRGKEDGVELHIDHIIPKEKGGKATIENGQVLCSQHNFQKKDHGHTETGKKMFINFYELAKHLHDEHHEKFFREILETYEKHQINSHINWKK